MLNAEPLSPNRRAGSLPLTAVLASMPEDAHLPTSLLQSWLPLNRHELDREGPAGFQCPGIIPTLIGENSYTRIAPIIEAYARAQPPHGWVVQPVAFSYQPDIFVTAGLINENGRLEKAKLEGRNMPIEERIMLDVSAQSETIGVCEPVLELCLEVLKPIRINLPAELLDPKRPRLALVILLAEYPFLVHHIFHAYPKLHVITHDAHIHLNREVKKLEVRHIRYHPGDAHHINTRKYMRQNIPNVTA